MTKSVCVLPAEVRNLALRLGASDERSSSIVALKQRGIMRAAPAAKPMEFTARQTIALDVIGFDWRAKCGPFGVISVTDYLRQESWGVRVRLLGLIPLATLIDSPAAIKGETMRYLAELPLAPDAILRNPQLVWQVIDERTLTVSAREGVHGGEVTLRLSLDGLVASIEATDRPRIEGEVTVERPWHGTFSDYRCIAGRTVPLQAEVSWILPTGAFKTWEGEMTDWALC